MYPDIFNESARRGVGGPSNVDPGESLPQLVISSLWWRIVPLHEELCVFDFFNFRIFRATFRIAYGTSWNLVGTMTVFVFVVFD